MLISFVIPCYHSEKTLAEVVHKIRETVVSDGRYEYEVVLVNDNPPDATYTVIRQLCTEDPHVKGVCMIRNFGQHAALLAAYHYVRGDIVVSLDDDNQTPPEETFKLVDALTDDVDVVYGDYPDQKFASLFRKFGSDVNDWATCWLLHKPKGLYLSSFFAAKKFVIDEVIRYTGPYPYVDGLLLRTTSRIINVPVVHRQRECGRSGYSLSKLLRLWMNGFTVFSAVPLRIVSVGGGLFTLAGLVATVVIIIRKLMLGSEIDAGWASIVCLMLIIGGMLMISIGLLGEYIGRIFISINQAPQYAVREECGTRAQEKASV